MRAWPVCGAFRKLSGRTLTSLCKSRARANDQHPTLPPRSLEATRLELLLLLASPISDCMGDEKKKLAMASAVYGPVDGSDSVRSLESVTPLSMDAEWDPYVQRKQHGVGLQPIVGVLRNDRTPLNTPYTPQLMKLHLKRHEEFDEQDEFVERPGKQLVTTVRSKIARVMQPVHKIRAVVERVLTMVVPGFIQRTTLFSKIRPWVIWHFTAVVCVPFVMLLSPMLIALTICTSPIWMSGIVVLFVRLLIRSHPPIENEFGRDSEEEDSSPHHPNSMYRRAHLTNNHGQRGYG